MTPHISAKKGEIAEAILLPGDPLRAKWIAETFLENPKCFNETRGMLGFTGTYKGERVSVMGTGMGLPSLSIYAHELMAFFGVKSLIRVGSCGAFADGLDLMDVVIASGACTDSAINRQIFGGITYAPVADFNLLRKAVGIAEQKAIRHHVGLIMSGDRFYVDESDYLATVKAYGVLAVEMESSGLYTLAAKFGAAALTLSTVSDILGSSRELSAKERQQSMSEMCIIALDTLTGDGK